MFFMNIVKSKLISIVVGIIYDLTYNFVVKLCKKQKEE